MQLVFIQLRRALAAVVLAFLYSTAYAGAAGKPLTQSEAESRATNLSSVKYTLEVDLASSTSGFEGTNTIGFTLSDAPKSDLWLDLKDATISRVDINGKSIKAGYDGIRLALPKDKLTKGRNRVSVHYAAKYSRDGAGLYRFEDSEDGGVYVYSDFEPYDANRLMPIFDQPDIKATYALTVLAPKDWQVISSRHPRKIEDDKTNRRWTFDPTLSFSSYVFSLHAGTYDVWEDKTARIPTRLFARKSLAKHMRPDEWFKTSRQGFDYYEKYFDIPHPFTKWDMVVVPDFNSGAMENVGAVTFSERYVARGPETNDFRRNRSEVILHEMAHMWFGNLVTMKWWDDLWLNESFATYMAYKALVEATEFTDAWRAFSSEMKEWAYWEDQLVTTHPIVANVSNTDEAFSNFDGITYGKGAAALKQLEFLIGADAFRTGVSTYLKDHKFDNATLADFMSALAKASKVNLDPWITAWLRTAGLNRVEARYKCEDNKISSFRLVQSASLENPTLRTHRTRIGLFYLNDAMLTAGKSYVLTYGPESHESADPVGQPCPDLVFLNLDDHDYAKQLLDPGSVATVKQHLSKVADTFIRSMIWNALWEMVRDAKLPVQEYADMAFRHLPQERDVEIIKDTLATLVGRYARSASVLSYFPRSSSEELKSFERFQAKLLGFTTTGLGNAAPGSDAQRVWFDAYVKSFQRPSQTAPLLALLRTPDKIPGLTLDQDLRWEIVKQLAYCNVKEFPEVLAAEKSRDGSSRGHKAALAAEAMRPDRGIKKKWVKTLLDPSSEKDLSLAEMKQIMWNLFPRGQESLLKPFAKEYYTALAPIAKNRDGKFAELFSSNLAPLFCDSRSNREMQNFIDKSAKNLGPIITRELKIEHQEDSRCIKITAAARAEDLRF